jgi:hypothetical protein
MQADIRIPRPDRANNFMLGSSRKSRPVQRGPLASSHEATTLLALEITQMNPGRDLRRREWIGEMDAASE